MVSVENLRHLYDEHIALDGVSFDIAERENFALLGPNGSGKSTLFKILTTLLRPTAGRAVIAGFDAATHPARVRASIGVVFQSPSLDIHLTVRENMIHHARLYGLSGSILRTRLDDAMKTLGIADRAQSRVKTLSGGLRRRVELAKCLVHRPSLLILDEPCTGLDPIARLELWQYLQALRRDHGVTLLHTTHDMEEADRCDRIAILDRGGLVALGVPEDLKQRIGGQCVTIIGDEAPALAGEIETRLGTKTAVVDGTIRVETPDGVAVMSRILADFGPRIRSITVGRPTLEDVFVHETGHRFDDASTAEVGA